MDNKGHFRFCSPYWNKSNKIRAKAPTFDLDDEFSNYPNIFFIKTEKELCKFIYNNFGSGEYRIIGHIMGRQGGWTFWRGIINKDGFIFFKQQIINKEEIKKLKKEHQMANTWQEKQDKQDEIDFNREIGKLDKQTIKYGFFPYLSPSGNRGQLIFWEDDEIIPIKKEFENWGESIKKENKKQDKIW